MASCLCSRLLSQDGCHTTTRQGPNRISPSMRRPVSVKSVFLFLTRGFLRLSRAASVAILPSAPFCGAMVRSVQVGRPPFSRCCYLIIDIASRLFDESWARTWAQSPELGGSARLYVPNSTPRSLPLHSAILFHKPVSFPLRLERVNRWERIASRRRPAFSSHLINGAGSTGRCNTI
jgi:hypothetical protein